MKLHRCPSENCDDRPEGAAVKYLIYHYTEGDLEQSLLWLTKANPLGQKVSAHYLICEQGDIYAIVAEGKRAWHAGVSAWEDDESLNATSIGIELVNPGMGPNYRDFPPAQMQALEELTKDILTRHQISPFHILAHSDIAPGRKLDPGDRFDWQGLASRGVGVYPSVNDSKLAPSVEQLQQKLKAYGYKLDATGTFDSQTADALRAFQLHFGYGDLAVLSSKLDLLLRMKENFSTKCTVLDNKL